jgi:hypothetical protein
MIEMFFAVTILLAIVAVVWLAAPWWLAVMVLAAGVLLLGRLLNPTPGAAPGEEEG